MVSSPFTSNRMATQPTVHPTFTQALVAGGLAGTSVDLLFFPIDTIKTRLQSSQGFIKAGGLGGIYRGVGSVVIGSAPGAAIFFTTYSTLKQNLPIDTTHPLNHVVAASISEVAACLVRVPTEVVKSRTQTSAYGAGVSSFGAFLKVAQSESLGGLYRGFGSTVMREIPFTSLQFPTYEFLKIKLGKTLDRPIDPHEAALCGSLAGAIAASATTPLDVLKTRIMLDVKDAPERRLSLTSRLIQIYQAEGLRALFAGVVPRTLWISAGGAVFLGVWEWGVKVQQSSVGI
ncbi:mitochondrial carrier protein [Rhizoctonia solani]|uniref:Mitochondrial carrier protein n=1 Tax=Rhizoctonia solani TaxID=456999 RepID=A0A8H8SXN1_9AGAM|nr:mitochondrial carrier protein [Rhizoctonia solani]QRW20488.1 mitochondrial carrier protein [Rhizoctonia solani]